MDGFAEPMLDARLADASEPLPTYKTVKMEIVGKTLSFQANVMFFQVLAIVLFRLVILSQTDPSAGTNAWTMYAASGMTLAERTSAGYFDAQAAKANRLLCKFDKSYCPVAAEAAPPAGNCTTIQSFYDTEMEPWNFPTFCKDAITRAFPDGMMPWWLIPVNQGFVAAFQYALIGFDLPFKPLEHHGRFEFVKKFVLTGLFLGLALKGYMVDFNTVSNIQGANSVETFIARTCVLMMSGNFLKAMAMWGGFRIQSPVAAVKCIPKYKCMPGCASFGFPLQPNGAVWLHPMKWLYAMVLAPYLLLVPVIKIVPGLLVFIGMAVACFTSPCGPCKACWNRLKWVFTCGPCFACWNCLKWTVTCGPCICCLKPCVYCLVSTVGTVCTLSFSTYARESFFYWSWLFLHIDHMWPVYGMSLLQAWSQFMPMLATFLYSLLICATSEERTEAMTDLSPMAGMAKMALPGKSSPEDQQAAIGMAMGMMAGQAGGGMMAGQAKGGMAMGMMAGPKGGALWTALFMLPKPLYIKPEVQDSLFKLDKESQLQDFYPPKHEEGGECPQQ